MTAEDYLRIGAVLGAIATLVAVYLVFNANMNCATSGGMFGGAGFSGLW